MKRRLVPFALISLLACRELPKTPEDPRPYAQAEEGLTLVFVDPSLKEPFQSADRLQVRVSRVTHREDGSLLVEKQFIRGLDRPVTSQVLIKDGGVSIVDAQGKVLGEALPAGFPDHVSTWTAPASAPSENRTRYTVIGHGAWAGASLLPPGSNAVGVWVEARPPRGLRTRSLYLHGLGEVETLEEQPGGSWTCVNRLQQRGFLDLPAAPTR